MCKLKKSVFKNIPDIFTGYFYLIKFVCQVLRLIWILLGKSNITTKASLVNMMTECIPSTVAWDYDKPDGLDQLGTGPVG
jgi:hypothetical protein